MSVLSDIDIMNLLNSGSLNIEPFEKKYLTPNGYDLSVDEIYIQSQDRHISTGVATIPALTWFAISTKEYVRMGAEITSQLWIRSSYARKGLMASFGKVDAGFHGTLTISCFNANNQAIAIPIGDRFCQIVFEQLSSVPQALYDERSGTYQHQRGITLPRK